MVFLLPNDLLIQLLSRKIFVETWKHIYSPNSLEHISGVYVVISYKLTFTYLLTYLWNHDVIVCYCFRANETNNLVAVIPPSVPEEVIVNGEQSDEEEEVPPSDDEEQEDPKDYCIGEY